MTLSVAIITHNEAANLPRTLQSVRWAEQMVVVDAASTDGTVEIARAAGAEVYVRAWSGFAAQKNFAIAQCTGDWVLSLDADEEVSAELAQEIRELLGSEDAEQAYYLPRRNYFLGRPLQHGGFYPDAKLRLFRRELFTDGKAAFDERAVHETLRCEGTLGELSGDLLHYAYPTLTSYIEHMNRYSTLGAGLLAGQKRVSRSLASFVWNVVCAPALQLFYNYGIRRGFQDGREGFLLHLYHAAYTSWKYAKAWELGRSKSASARGDQ